MNYYIYTERFDKQNAYDLKGLASNLREEGVLKLVKDKIPEITKLYTTKTKVINPTDFKTSMYLVIINRIQLTDVNKIQNIHHTRVTWERHTNSRHIIQCHYCQRWGHATSNCNMPPKCLKCAGAHRTHTCQKTAGGMCKLQRGSSCEFSYLPYLLSKT